VETVKFIFKEVLSDDIDSSEDLESRSNELSFFFALLVSIINNSLFHILETSQEDVPQDFEDGVREVESFSKLHSLIIIIFGRKNE